MAKRGGALTIGHHPQLSSDYEEDYDVGICRPESGGVEPPYSPPPDPPLITLLLN